MSDLKLCKECGTPLLVAKRLIWNSGGEIYQKKTAQYRQVFFESDNIDNLFQGISKLIGVSIDHIVIESVTREVKKYVEADFPAWTRRVFNSFTKSLEKNEYVRLWWRPVFHVVKMAARSIVNLGVSQGMGIDTSRDKLDYKNPQGLKTITVHNPYSVLLYAGGVAASGEALTSRDQQVTYKKIGDSTYEFVLEDGPHALNLKARLQRKSYNSKPGNLTYERCSRCGVPIEVARYNWDLSKGIIKDPNSGRRMTVFSPYAVEAVLGDLETELGEAIPQATIEAQRRYIKTIMRDDELLEDASNFHHMLSLRGLGNLTRMESTDKSILITIENPCMHLLMIGMVQAIYEMAFDVDSTADWDLAEDGDLNIRIGHR